MSKITMIVGLPGSGKTTYAQEMLCRSYPIKLFDDAARFEKGMEDLRRYVRNGGTAIVTDVYNITPEARATAEAKMLSWSQDEWNPHSRYKVVVEWIFFENDPEACIVNIKRRNEENPVYREIPDGYVRELSRQYQIPADAKVIPVYKPLDTAYLNPPGRLTDDEHVEMLRFLSLPETEIRNEKEDASIDN